MSVLLGIGAIPPSGNIHGLLPLIDMLDKQHSYGCSPKPISKACQAVPLRYIIYSDILFKVP